MNNKILPRRISKIAFPEILGAPSVKKKRCISAKNSSSCALNIFDFDPATLQTQAHAQAQNYFPVLQFDFISYKQKLFTLFPRPFFVPRHCKQH